ncbi:MAG: cytochrome c [Thiobacillaceae bacterium]|nr:cytochrome c [Thiobacillaceae bacterium]MCX7673589.1 cytochrome c [Thiobacillaceae bacterium]MDW8324586.1 cytochrome c [Burkholderiales bacterium]
MEFLGMYPTWHDTLLGSGWVLGIIAVVHVLASHVSVGAALVFAWLATAAYRRRRPELLEYVRRYGVLLLVFSYVVGSITGPGIWYSATVASPRGISALIHSYVWIWATEWVFFVGEVVGIYALVYLANKVDQKTHLKLTLFFAIASWCTMLIIVGILSFMMWPGQPEWFTQGGTLNGFYGPYTFGQIITRTAFMLVAAAVVGGIVASRIDDTAFRQEMTRKLAVLGIVAAVVGFFAFQWTLTTLPEHARTVMAALLPDWFVPSLWAVLIVTVAYFALTWALPRVLTPWLSVGMAAVLLVFGIWPEETARESMRKPWVAGQYVYSNQVIGRDVPALRIRSEVPMLEQRGMLASHPFIPANLRRVTEENTSQAGYALYLAYCSNCHNLGKTGIRPFGKKLADMDEEGLYGYLTGALASGSLPYMPHMPLKEDEARALARFLIQEGR